MIGKINIFLSCLFVSVVVNAAEIDDMMSLESLFNLDVEQSEETSNMVLDVVLDEKEGVKPEVVTATIASTAELSRDELELELVVSRQEVLRLRDIVRRILVSNRRERAEMEYNLGCVFRHGGYKERAEEAFLNAIKINPDDPVVHYNLGILYDEDFNMPKKAIKHYKRYLELSPGDKDAGKVYEWIIALKSK